ncbi:MAG: acyl-CoA dehydrogenase [Pseudomonadota bacterium]|nr:acyl-CoA dehydrogenase [Pseudomonadota bacterium]
MSDFTAPLRDMQFVIEELVGLDEIAALPGGEEVTTDLVRQILNEAGRFGADVLRPLNRVGDLEGSRLENGVVSTPTGFADAYKAFVDAGWNSVAHDPDYGGMGLPTLVATATTEIWAAANFGFSLCPVLTHAGVELLSRYGSEEQKDTYLPNLISGVWPGAMVMTESHAGTDIGELRTRAVPDGDHYHLFGQKIFISWGDHDMADNIIHMVLARAEGSPPGVKGLSMFIVPKFLVKPDGSLGQRNDMRAVNLEHKLGIHASPTAMMSYGDNDGAIGYLIGEENRGIEYMFSMMNSARLAIGLESVGIAECAYQQAREYAMTRLLGRDVARSDADIAPIIRHPDVRRMLLSMKSRIEATRALSYIVAAWLDIARRHSDEETRRDHQAKVDFLIPVVKAWSSDIGFDAASTGVQIHGGAGFIEETGAAQHMRDARINMIYEGTNGIQAMDLVARKLIGDDGAVAGLLIDEMREFGKSLDGNENEDIAVIHEALADGVAALEQATVWLLACNDSADNPTMARLSGATAYLDLVGTVIGGYLMARSALLAARGLEAANGSEEFYSGKITTARFYAEQFLSQTQGFMRATTTGSASIMVLTEAQF